MDAACDCIIFCVRAAGCLPAACPAQGGSTGIPGGIEGKDRGGGEGIKPGLLLHGDVPPPLLLELNEPALEKHMALVLPRGKWDTAAGRGASPCPPSVCN